MESDGEADRSSIEFGHLNSVHVKINSVEANSEELEDSKRPFLACDFAGDNQHVLADSGSFMSVMDDQYLCMIQQKLGESACTQLRTPKITASSASGHDFQVIGVFSVPMTIKQTGTAVAWPFLVVRGLSSPVILGSEFLAATDAEIRSAQRRVHWPRGFRLPTKKCLASLRARQDVFVDALTTRRVTARVTAGQKGQVGVCRGPHNLIIEALSAVNGDGNCDVVICNNRHTPMRIPRGYDLGEFMAIDESTLVPLGKINDHLAPDTPLSTEKREYLRALLDKKEIDPSVKGRLWEIIMRQHEAFSAGPFDLGYSDAVSLSVRMKTVEPIHTKQFPIPWAHREKMDEYVRELLAKGCVEPSRSPYNSPVFGVPKKDGGVRMVLDYRRINDNSYEDKHVIKEVQDCIDTVGERGSTFFSTLDLTSGFWQQNLTEDSRAVTAFTIPGQGRFQWTRVPMGLAGSPAAFSRLIEDTIRGLEGVQGYLDDLLVHSRTLEDHFKDLEACLIRLRKFNLKLNIRKCDFLAAEVPYLGFTLTRDGVLPGKQKLMAVKEFPPLTNVRQIRQFMGLCNYFRHMIPRYALLAGHLSKLLTKDSGYKEGPLPAGAQIAMDEMKRYLTQAPVMAYPNPRRDFILSTDAAGGDSANPGGLGAVLSQLDDGGVERVVAYASRSLRPNEKNYSAFLLELTAIVWAVEHFHVYLYGNRFSVVTDHRPLETMKTIHKKTLNRLQEKLITYNFTLRYRPGKENGPADALSRNPVGMVEAVAVAVAVQRGQATDPDCCKIRETGGPYAVRGNVLYRHVRSLSTGERWCVVLPATSRKRVLEAAHDSPLMGHQGTM